MDPVPPLYEPPKPGLKKSVIFSSIIVAFLLLAIPIGVYLTRQQQNLNSKASAPKQAVPKNSLFLTYQRQLDPGELTVNLYARADVDSINLIAAKIKYPQDILEPDSIATAAADLAPDELQIPGRWIEADSGKDKITVSLGIPNPGFKTNVSDPTKHLVAKIKFKVKAPGAVSLTFEAHDMLRNSDSLNVVGEPENLTVNLENGGPFYKAATESATESAKLAKNSPTLEVLSPQGGEVFAYFNPINIKWQSQNVEKVTISLMLNESLFGNLATNIDNTGTFSWKPSLTLPLTYINSNNSYQIKLTGVSLSNSSIAASSLGPFGLVAQTDAKVKPEPKLSIERFQADLNNDAQVNYSDISLLLANFNKQNFSQNMDFNGDGLVNAIDLFLLKNAFLRDKSIR